MLYRHRTQAAFTLVELAIVITIIGILATIGTFSFVGAQKAARDSQREADTTLIAEALEKYYNENGEYPGCNALKQNPAVVTKDILPNIGADSLKSPKLEKDVATAIICSNLSTTSADRYAYLGDDSDDCISGIACLGWVLRYKSESSNEIKEIRSHHSLAR